MKPLILITAAILFNCLLHCQMADFTFHYDNSGNRTQRIYNGIQPVAPPDEDMVIELVATEEGEEEVIEISEEPLGEELEEGKILIYPNPNEGYLNVYLPLNDKATAIITLFDYAGRQVYQTFTTSNENHMDIRALQNGTFILKIEMDGRMVMERIVKR